MNAYQPSRCHVSIPKGEMESANGRYVKKLSDLREAYADRDAFDETMARDGDFVAYEVTDFRPSSSEGDLIFGVTRMAPGRIGDEFFLTRGHVHAKADRPEIYYGQAGRGLMQLESLTGETRIVEINPGDICYVPPYWIHRSVNVGDENLVMVFCYPADSGQDYGIIERSGGLRHRVVAEASGGWKLVDNPHYRPRSDIEIKALAGHNHHKLTGQQT